MGLEIHAEKEYILPRLLKEIISDFLTYVRKIYCRSKPQRIWGQKLWNNKTIICNMTWYSLHSLRSMSYYLHRMKFITWPNQLIFIHESKIEDIWSVWWQIRLEISISKAPFICLLTSAAHEEKMGSIHN